MVGPFDPSDISDLGFLTIGPPGLSQIRYGPTGVGFDPITIVTR